MKTLVIGLIRIYQGAERAMRFHRIGIAPGGCRSWPTCSDYTIAAVQQYGAVKGLAKGCIRVLRCNPLFAPHQTA